MSNEIIGVNRYCFKCCNLIGPPASFWLVSLMFQIYSDLTGSRDFGPIRDETVSAPV